MAETTIDTVDTLLDSVQRSVDDPELTFKLRTARQLLLVIDEQHEAARDALDHVEIDEEMERNLRKLGYIE